MSQPAPLPPPQPRPYDRISLPDGPWQHHEGHAIPMVTERYYPPKRLRSEQVIVQAPMSFTGAAKRSWKLTRVGPVWMKLVTVPAALMLLSVWWALVACWYAVFLIPAILWRPFFGRRRRKAKREAARHRELLEELGRR